VSRYALAIHPDDAATWKAMTGRDETRPDEMPPIKSRAGLDFMVASAERNGIRLEWRDLDEGEGS
jgi:hypothetical protein